MDKLRTESSDWTRCNAKNTVRLRYWTLGLGLALR